MIIFKPEWVAHTDEHGKKASIYSIDVCSNGSRLATGSSDGTIKIWNTKPIHKEEAEQDPNCHKLLSTLRGHLGGILCIRWSNNSKYLASCSDSDNMIIIWKENEHKSWEIIHRLKGHAFDVQGLAWSKDNEYLASCGAEGLIIIWDGSTFEQVKTIQKHEGRVNGVVWDPAGKYLASQSDDKTIRIWRTTDWSLDTTIKNPFVHTLKTVLFNRLSWSPEGQHIAVANATNSQKPVASIVAREDWNSDVSLVGHKHPVEVTSFNPKLFYINEDSADGLVYKSISSICALGSQDRSVSIWVTKSSKPVCVAADIFDHNIYDITWSPDGRSLFACSQDGTVVFLQLQEELDDAVPENAVITQLLKYGYQKNIKPREIPQLVQRSNNIVEKPIVIDSPSTIETPTEINTKNAFIQPIFTPTAPIIPTVNTEPSGTKRRQSKEEDTRATKSRVNWVESGITPPILKISQIKMALPKILSGFNIKSKGTGMTLECHNSLGATSAILSKIIASENNAQVWSDNVSSVVNLMTSNSYFSAASCEDGTIHTWSPAGKRMLPAIVLDSPCAVLQNSQGWLICITATGLLYSWDLINLKSCLEGISIGPILHVAQLEAEKTHEAPQIKCIRVQKNGLPMVITNSHQAFAYHLNMKVWLRVSDAWYILSEFWGTSARKEDHPLAWLALHNQGPVSNQILLDMSAASKVVTTSHIETQLAVAALLDSPVEYKDWMIYYVRRLSEENAKHKVEELCKWLVGPPYSLSADLVKWEPTILGEISKQDLLIEILPLLAKNRQLQRTIQEFTCFTKNS